MRNFGLHNKPWMIKVNDDCSWRFEGFLNQESDDASLTISFEETKSLGQTKSGL